MSPVDAVTRVEVDVTQEIAQVPTAAPPEPAGVVASGSRHRAPAYAPQAAGARRGSGAASLAWILAAVSLLALWSLLFAFVFSGLQEQRVQRELYASLRGDLDGSGPTVAPLGGAIAPGTPVALLSSPRAGLDDAVVVEGTRSSDLEAGPGHLRTSVLPGQPGTSVVYGRSVTYGAPFRDITRLQVGDLITATTGQGVFTYRVDRIRHAGDTVYSLPVGGGRLTLVSSTGPGWHARWAPTSTVFVDALLTTTAQPAPPGRVTTYLWSELPMHGQLGALVPLVLLLLLLAGTTVLLVFTRAWWGGWQAWLVGAPVVVALLWLATETASELLPNLF